MKQYQLAMPQQVFSGETGMQALESLAARHKKAAVFTDAGIRASGVLERPLAELDKAAVPYIINDTCPRNLLAIRLSRSSIPSARATQT